MEGAPGWGGGWLHPGADGGGREGAGAQEASRPPRGPGQYILLFIFILTYKPGFRIRIHFGTLGWILIRIQGFYDQQLKKYKI